MLFGICLHKRSTYSHVCFWTRGSVMLRHTGKTKDKSECGVFSTQWSWVLLDSMLWFRCRLFWRLSRRRQAASRSRISNNISLALLMRLHQMKPPPPPPRSRYSRCTGGRRMAIFVSTPSTSLSLSLPPPHCIFCYTTPTPTYPHPGIVAPLFGQALWIEARADKSLHGDSAICKSCCGRRVFFFPLFPPSLLLSPPPACTQPLPSPPSYSCIPFLRLILLLFRTSPVISCASLIFFFFFTFPFPPPPSHSLRHKGVGGWGRHNVHLTFNQRLSQHAALEQTGWYTLRARACEWGSVMSGFMSWGRESCSTFGILRHVQGKLGTIGDPYWIWTRDEEEGYTNGAQTHTHTHKQYIQFRRTQQVIGSQWCTIICWKQEGKMRIPLREMIARTSLKA